MKGVWWQGCLANLQSICIGGIVKIRERKKRFLQKTKCLTICHVRNHNRMPSSSKVFSLPSYTVILTRTFVFQVFHLSLLSFYGMCPA